jgi:hypothetical protein
MSRIQQMIEHIDTKAGAVRACYITVAPGQEATYILKGNQAREFVAANYLGDVPVLIQSEMNATGESAESAANRICYEEQLWIGLAGMIETARRSGKVALLAAINDEERDSIYSATINTLTAMMQ